MFFNLKFWVLSASSTLSMKLFSASSKFPSINWIRPLRIKVSISSVDLFFDLVMINKWDIPNTAKFETVGIKKQNEQLLKKAVEEPEREHIISVLDECGWNRIRAARALGVNRTTLYNKMKKYSISEKARS